MSASGADRAWRGPVLARCAAWLVIKRKLRDHGVKDVTDRELDDAIARTIPDVTDLIVEKILDARRRKFEDD
ncbi:hypothetical protein [Halarchaeum nitratireducens]|nr:MULTISPECIES: hypothetical protein [Halarchaeum]MBP2252489.1 hypothetical protein [Halarchaeum solikamskense]